MGYVESNLLKGEEVLVEAKIHWAIYIKAICVLIVGAFFLAGDPTIGGLIIAVGFILLIRAVVIAKTTELVVTNQRLIGKVGFAQRDTLELKYEKVESIGINQDVIGRIFGCSTVSVRGTGGSAIDFGCIASPVNFKNSAMECIN